MDDFVSFAVSEGGDATTAKLLWRSGCTDSLVKKAKEVGLEYSDIEEMYSSFGPPCVLVMNELLSRIKK